jgi:sugar phosphate isomerase/epimerase
MYKNLNLGALGHGNVPFDQACALAQRYHFPGIDLDLGYLSTLAKQSSLQSAKEWFASTGLKPGAIGVSAKWREGDSDAAFADSLKDFTAQVKLGAAFGSARCTTWVLPFSDKLTFREHWNLTVPRLQRVAEVLGESGMHLGLEFVGPATLRTTHKYDFVHNLDGMRAYAAAIGSRTANTGLLLDVWHWYTAYGTLRDIEFLDPAEVVYVHVNDAPPGLEIDKQIDNQREMVGATGVIDIKGFMGALRKIGCDAPVTVEPFNKAVREMPAEEAARVTSAALDKIM